MTSAAMQGNSILVTGGAGFIGSNFVLQWLATEPAGVVNLDKLTYAGNPENLATVASDQRYKFMQGDICDREMIAELLLMHRPRAIVHFGAESHAFRFLHVSTDEVYGSLSAADPAFTESTRYAPNSPYSASKAASDHLVRAYFHTYGL